MNTTDLCIFQGRFQGLNIGHQQVILDLQKRYKRLTVFIVEGKNKDSKNPFNGKLRKELIESACPGTEVYIVPTAFIPGSIKYLGLWKGSEEVHIASGDDREESYKKQKSDKTPYDMEYIRTVRPDGVSGTAVRQSLKDDDFEKYKSVSAKGINTIEYFNKLKKAIFMESYKSFRDFLVEGGNVVLATGEAAQKIPIENIDRTLVQNLIKVSLGEFNDEFKKQTGQYLWTEFENLVTSGLIFSGSSRLLFAKEISDDEFATHKKKVGDIDLQFDKNKHVELKTFLKKNENTYFGKLRYVANGGNSPTQENVLFEFPIIMHDVIRYVQIDFEPVDFIDDGSTPTEFSIFAHYSSWKDIKEGIKGVFVKYLYRSIFSNVEKMHDYIIVTTTGKISSSKAFEAEIGKYKFSVDKGVRIGYAPVMENGIHKKINGKHAYTVIDSKTAEYDQGMDTIFQLAFSKSPSDKDKNIMKSFVGALELLKNKSDKENESIYLDFINLLWGKGAQGLERDNPELDFENKDAAHDKYISEFPFLTKFDKKVQEMVKDYYKAYKR